MICTNTASRRLPILTIIGAILVAGGYVVVREVSSRSGQKESFSHAGAGQKIRKFAVGTRMAEVDTILGPPDEKRTDGTYTEWSYLEGRTVRRRELEGWTRPRQTSLQTSIRHRLLFRGEELLIAMGAQIEVGVMNREVRLAYRRLEPRMVMPALPLESGIDLHTAMSSVVDGKTTFAQHDCLIGPPAVMRQQGELAHLLYTFSMGTGRWMFHINIKDGVVVENPYSPPGTDADEAVRELFYLGGTWPQVPYPSRD